MQRECHLPRQLNDDEQEPTGIRTGKEFDQPTNDDNHPVLVLQLLKFHI